MPRRPAPGLERRACEGAAPLAVGAEEPYLSSCPRRLQPSAPSSGAHRAGHVAPGLGSRLRQPPLRRATPTGSSGGRPGFPVSLSPGPRVVPRAAARSGSRSPPCPRAFSLGSRKTWGGRPAISEGPRARPVNGRIVPQIPASVLVWGLVARKLVRVRARIGFDYLVSRHSSSVG